MDVAEIITAKVLEQLKNGVIPWRKPWSVNPETGRKIPPTNLVSRRPYRGVNAVLLSMFGYASPYWLSFKQAAEKGGAVRKGERGTMVVFYRVIDKTNPDGTPALDKHGRPVKAFLLRYSTVFNVEQTEGVKYPAPVTPGPSTESGWTPDAAAEAIVAGYPNPPTISYTGDRAYYAPLLDAVTVPPKTAFPMAEQFYETLFHELVHSTGHPSRLSRDAASAIVHFGDDLYSKEELIAEMGAAFLVNLAGLPFTTIDNTASYLANWLSRLGSDPKLLIAASSKAQAAVDHITNTTPKEDN